MNEAWAEEGSCFPGCFLHLFPHRSLNSLTSRLVLLFGRSCWGRGGGKSSIVSYSLYCCLLNTQYPPVWQPMPWPHFTDQWAEPSQEVTRSFYTWPVLWFSIFFFFKLRVTDEVVDQTFICWTSSKLIAISWRIQSTTEPNILLVLANYFRVVI